ncbi:MAG: hypothetical protein KKH98_06935 [Spirochaetes bacterium]|nr:hypothetical protein [Spirochaetota bacterium]
MMIKRLFILLLVLLSAYSFAFGSFLSLDGGVRTKGMGGAFTGIADDVNGVYYNPAGLGQFNKGEIYLTYNNYYSLDLINSFMFSIATSGIADGTFGFSYQKLGVGEKVKFMGDYGESIYNFSYGVELVPMFYLGANAKFFKINYDVKASAISYDASLLIRTFEKHLSVGLILKNINQPVIRWENATKETVEYSIRVGAGIRPNNDVVIGVDVDGINQEDYDIHAGGEMWFLGRLVAPRIGVALLQGDGLALNIGGSLQYKDVRVDYAFEKHYELGYDHLFGVLIKF